MKNIKKELKELPHLQYLLFRRGYLLTSESLEITSEFPFYNNWIKREVGGYYLYTHKDQKHFIQEVNGANYILVGRAYNPWDKISAESTVLEKLVEAENIGSNNFFEELSKVTGVFSLFKIKDKEIWAVQDSVGIMPIFYNEIKGETSKVYLSSHAQLIADICGFTLDPQIERLVNAKFYLIGIRHLAGIKSPFKEIKLLTANTYLQTNPFKITRFFPNDQPNIMSEGESLQTISNILANSMAMISEKNRAAISLTGGTDSKMTLAAANNIYEKFDYFSFYSSEAEYKDALAANEISNQLGLKHKIYTIPENNEMIEDFETINQIIDYNTSGIKKHGETERRKIAHLLNQQELEFEVKSHVSEIARGFYYEKHGLKKMPEPLKARHMSNFYKRNMFDRKTLKYMDKAFQEFIDVTGFGYGFGDRYDESDMFYWEHRMSQWAAFVKQDFDISHETTIIYNNRKLMDLFMNFELKDRIADIPQQKIIKNLNQELYDLNIDNKNAMSNKGRILLERVFFEVNSLF